MDEFLADPKVASVLGATAVAKYKADLVSSRQRQKLDTEADVRKALTRSKRLLLNFCILYRLNQKGKAPGEANHELSEKSMEQVFNDYRQNCRQAIKRL